jgi:hypothetical protein
MSIRVYSISFSISSISVQSSDFLLNPDVLDACLRMAKPDSDKNYFS